MAIQQTIIEALKNSTSAHHAAIEEVKKLRAEKAALEAHVAALSDRVGKLEPEMIKVVEPGAVQSLLDELSISVANAHALFGVQQTPAPAPAPAPAQPAAQAEVPHSGPAAPAAPAQS